MRAVCISDTHGQHLDLRLPEGDVLVHAGDLTSRGTLEESADFLDWFSSQNYTHKILIAGNHDFIFEQETREKIAHLIPENVNYLNDSSVQINGFTFWGSPVTPWFHNWAFNRNRGPEIKDHWDRISMNTDVLITHGPPQGVLDRTVLGSEVGCEELREKLTQLKPRYHIFGHIHEGYGRYRSEGTEYLNASVLNERYQLCNKPHILDLNP